MQYPTKGGPLGYTDMEVVSIVQLDDLVVCVGNSAGFVCGGSVVTVSAR